MIKRVFACARRFHFVEFLVGGGEQSFGGDAAGREDGDAGAYGNLRNFRLLGEIAANALGYAQSGVFSGLRQNHGEFVAAIAGGRIDRARSDAQSFGEPAERAAAHQMAVVVVNIFEPIQIEQDDGKLPSGSRRSFRLQLPERR